MLPIVLPAILAQVNAHRLTQSTYLDKLTERRRIVPDLIVLVTGVGLLVSMIVVNNIVNDVENRHPAREFDASEAGERLDSALDPLLPVLAEVEGMPDPVREHSDEVACSDGAGWDEEWSEHDQAYFFEDREAQVNISPNAGAGQRALEAVRAYLTANDWDITLDEHQSEWFYRLSAVRDDGVRVTFEVGAGMTNLTATTGCIRNAETDQ
jgi:hypothetical protein